MDLKKDRLNHGDDTEYADVHRQLAPHKRKLSTTGQCQDAAQSKRKKGNSTSEASDALNPELEISNASEPQLELTVNDTMVQRQSCRPLLRSILSLATALQTAETEHPKMLASIRRLVSAIADLSKEMSDSNHTMEASKATMLEQVCVVFTRIYPVLIRSVQAIFDRKEQSQSSMGVTEIVRTFQIFLDQLHQSSFDELVGQEKQAKPRNITTRSQSMEAIDKDVHSNYHRHCRSLVRVLDNMFTTLDVAQPSHCEVLEGLICSLLDRVGTILALLVFADPKMPSRDLGGICPPYGLIHVSHLNCKDAIVAAKLEGPWLLQILEHAIAFLYSNVQTMKDDSLIQFVPSNWAQLKGAGLREGLRQSLQHTLLRGVFGGDDEAFNDALRRMEECHNGNDNAESASLKTGQQEPADSFIEQLWETLGWGILSSKRLA